MKLGYPAEKRRERGEENAIYDTFFSRIKKAPGGGGARACRSHRPAGAASGVPQGSQRAFQFAQSRAVLLVNGIDMTAEPGGDFLERQVVVVVHPDHLPLPVAQLGHMVADQMVCLFLQADRLGAFVAVVGPGFQGGLYPAVAEIRVPFVARRRISWRSKDSR